MFVACKLPCKNKKDKHLCVHMHAIPYIKFNTAQKEIRFKEMQPSDFNVPQLARKRLVHWKVHISHVCAYIRVYKTRF